jgi:hypothetical protein
MNETKLVRNFTNKTGVSKHLMCIVCQDLFNDPKRLNCGHTYCGDCLNEWIKSNKICPICRVKICQKNIGRDLIAFNIINDMEVTCNNKGNHILTLGCPWKSTLNNLVNHLKYCCYEANKLPDYIKKRVDSTQKFESNEDGEYESDKYLDFNPRASLAQRLYNKNPESVNNALQDNIVEEL